MEDKCRGIKEMSELKAEVTPGSGKSAGEGDIELVKGGTVQLNKNSILLLKAGDGKSHANKDM